MEAAEPTSRPHPSSKLRAITVAQRAGAWWFISGEGTPFVSLGINHVEPWLMTQPYNLRATLDRYGADLVNGCFNPDGDAARNWLTVVKQDFRNWGFDTFGFHTSVPLRLVSSEFRYIARVQCATDPYVDGAPRPDVFAPEFERDVAQEARVVCEAHRHSENLLGYAFLDLPEWPTALRQTQRPDQTHLLTKLNPWVAALASLPPGAPGKQAWIDVLCRNHGDAARAAAAYGIEGSCWDDLARATEWIPSTDTPAGQRDSELLLTAIAERWYALHVAHVRSHDPHHLILGDKLRGAAGLPDYLATILRKHLDVLLVQWYGRFDQQEETLRTMYEATGKPILMGDSAFSVIQPHQATAKGLKVETQQAVGAEYAAYLEKLVGLPFVVGWHHCGYVEEWDGSTARVGATVPLQCGLKDPFENVHDDAVSQIRQCNARAHAWHLSSISKE